MQTTSSARAWHRPDLLVADINMPPGHGDDGLVAALEVRQRRPETAVLVLSQYYDERYAMDLLADGADGVGYLLKERVGRVEEFVEGAIRVAEGGSAVDPEVVARMVGRRRKRSRVFELSPRELDVMAAMAEGKSNRGIAGALSSAWRQSRSTSPGSSTSWTSTPSSRSTGASMRS
jgi:DNA-binding NarL/FixJ family response regulator